MKCLDRLRYRHFKMKISLQYTCRLTLHIVQVWLGTFSQSSSFLCFFLLSLFSLFFSCFWFLNNSCLLNLFFTLAKLTLLFLGLLSESGAGFFLFLLATLSVASGVLSDILNKKNVKPERGEKRPKRRGSFKMVATCLCCCGCISVPDSSSKQATDRWERV